MAEPVVAASNRDIRCPRCGYDQRGIMATWSETCPLTGTCSECGLLYHWSEVLHPEKFEPLWCVEFIPRFRPWTFLWAAIRTFSRSFWPWRFWSRVQMSQPIRWVRLILYMLSFALLIPFSCIPIQAGAAIYLRSVIQNQMDQQLAQAPVMVQSFSMQLKTLKGLTSDESTNADAGQALLEEDEMQLAAEIAEHWKEQTGAMTQEQRQQMIAFTQQQLSFWQNAQTFPPSISASSFELAVEAVLFPTRQFSNTVINFPGATMPYPAPIELWPQILQYRGSAWSGPSSMTIRAISGMLGWFTATGVMAAMLPASLVLLPVSRRKAKVRWSHITRVWCYSVFLVPTMLLAGLALIVLGELNQTASNTFQFLQLAIVGLLPPIMLICWWGAAIGRYLKIPHGHFTAFMLWIMCLLLLAAGLYLILPWAVFD